MEKREQLFLGFLALMIVLLIAMGLMQFLGADLSARQTEGRRKIGAVYMTLNNPFYEVVDEEISVGDFVCFDPRPRVTRSGYIKSRYLDDKLSVGCVLALAKYLKDEKILFSGDTLFCGSVGRTDFPGGSMAQMRQSLRRLLDTLPGDTDVYPGHDSATTIDMEKRYNPFA